jgi:hypothetical protein
MTFYTTLITLTTRTVQTVNLPFLKMFAVPYQLVSLSVPITHRPPPTNTHTHTHTNTVSFNTWYLEKAGRQTGIIMLTL